jgi:hypothetical protein
MVNYEDLQIMSDDWAVSDYNISTSNPTDANLLAYYKFEGNYIDSSGNGRNGTAVNGVTVVYDATRDSNVLKLPGSGDYVNCGGGKVPLGPNTWADVNGPITVAAWFKIVYNNHRRADDWMPIVCKGENAWRLQAYDPYGAYWGCTGLGESPVGWGVELTGGTYVNDGKWHHTTGVYDPNADGDGTGKVYLYVDGYLFDSHDANGMIQDGNDSRAAVTIGENLGDPGPSTFEGYIDEVRIYSRALSQAQVAYLAGDGANPFRLRTHTQASLYDDPGNAVNFKDFALLAADNWLVEDRLFGD